MFFKELINSKYKNKIILPDNDSAFRQKNAGYNAAVYIAEAMMVEHLL